METQTLSLEMLSKLGAEEFDSFGELETSIIRVFNESLAKLPPAYSYRDFIHFAQKRGLIVRTDAGHYRLRI